MKIKGKIMQLLVSIGVMIFFIILLLTCSAPAKNNTAYAPLRLIQTIALQNVKGRIDHMAFNRKQSFIYIAALGNNTVEVVDLKNQKITHTIKGLSEPQGIRYVPAGNSIFIANGNTGSCDIYNADSYQKITSVALGSDADNVRYDSISNRVYVGYGDGAIAVIDGSAYKRIADIKLPAHPESFQLDDKKLYVNVPEAHEIDIINLERNTVEARWDIKEASSNFPMALDKVNHRLFVGCRHPSKLLIMDTENGKTIAAVDIDGDTDDIFYDSTSKQIYVSCGGGKLNIIEQIDQNNYKSVSEIKTRSGARTSLFIPEINQLIVAAPARSGNEAELLVYGKK